MPCLVAAIPAPRTNMRETSDPHPTVSPPLTKVRYVERLSSLLRVGEPCTCLGTSSGEQMWTARISRLRPVQTGYLPGGRILLIAWNSLCMMDPFCSHDTFVNWAPWGVRRLCFDFGRVCSMTRAKCHTIVLLRWIDATAAC